MKKLIIKASAVIILLSIILTAFSACTIQRAYPGAPEGMRPINEGDEGAILYVPISWTVDTSTGIPTAYFAANDRTTITLTTVPADIVGEMSAKDYWESFRDTFEAQFSDFKIEKENEDDKDYTTRIIAEQGSYIYTFSAKITNISYKIRQAVLKNPTTGVVYIITYSTDASVFDRHIDDLNQAYDTFKLVTERIPMEDKTDVLLPPTDGINVPDGYTLISGSFVDYMLFVPADWTPTVITGMTSAHAPDKKTVSVNSMAFQTTITSLDEYWTEHESDLKTTFGELTYLISENKFTDIKLDGYDARCYKYSVVQSGTTYVFNQVILISGGYVYLLTFCADEAEFDSYSSAFNGIVENFKFKS